MGKQNQGDRKDLQKWIKQEIQEANHHNMKTIIGGDLNSIAYKDLYSHPLKRKQVSRLTPFAQTVRITRIF